MFALLAALIIVAGTAVVSTASNYGPIPSYYDQLQYNLTGPGTRATSISGYANPAFYSMMPGSELNYSWTGEDELKNWGLFLGGTNAGFGMVRSDLPVGDGVYAGVYDYRVALSGGTRNATVGVSFGWSGGDKDLVGRSQVIQVGAAQRFGRYVSLGLVGNFATQASYQSGFFDIAVRPTGKQLLTLFADYELPKGLAASDAPWSVGAMVDVGPGLQLTGRYFESEEWSLGIGYAFDVFGFTGAPRFNKDNKSDRTIYQIRTGFAQRDVLTETLQEDKTYVSMNLKGPVSYRAYQYFDKRKPLSVILADLEHAKNDPKVKGVAINLSGTVISRGKAWEIREKCADLQAAGKHVVIYVDNMGMTEYHLASVADKIVMDPEGMVMLPGYVMGRTFVTNLLKKLGVGVDEWRFFKYKSAAEAFTREDMSEADREQRLAIIEDTYETVRAEITAARNKSDADFDNWINNEIMFSGKKAKEMGLVDELGRWDKVKEVIAVLEGEQKRFVGRDELAGNRYKDDLWGEDPRIAVVYGLGACAMDTGIKARQLEKVFNGLAKSRNVKAVVFRVDSPGGDGMASDVVAEALRKCAERKPVIVSQGDVAGSGGYWISMYGTKIYALPTSITGSIGVIGAWVWDEGLGEKIGHTSDHVKVGDHADFGYGIRLLLGGPMLPERNLTTEERDRVKGQILDFYDVFVEKVATGRKMPADDVREIAQGHVYSGTRGKEIGLVDEIGGLDAAIKAAWKMAGIPDDDRVKIVEYPKLPPFHISLGGSPIPIRMLAGLFGGDTDMAEDEEALLNPEWSYLRAVANSPGRPLFMLPPEHYIYEAQFGGMR